MFAMKIIIVRHGKDDDRYRGGWSSLDLIPEGVEQARRVAEHLKKNNEFYGVAKLISSDLLRAMTTARIISNALNIPVVEDFRLRETNNGDLAGMLNDDAIKRYPGLFWSTLEMDERYPNGESPIEFFQRIKTWFDDFMNEYQHSEDNILIVTHGGVINIIYHIVRKVEWSNKSRLFKSENCGIHVLDTEIMDFVVENRTDFLL